MSILEKNANIHPIVEFNSAFDKISRLDLSATNPDFNAGIFNDMELFNSWIDQQLNRSGARYLVGGYKENRQMYSRSELFGKEGGEPEEARSLHLGIDIWAEAGTPIFAPLDGEVHSFAFNNNFGDYGATIILKHQLEGKEFFALYGHLSTRDLQGLDKNMLIRQGNKFAHFGPPAENGHWPPHLHLQLINDMAGWNGDYPGVCKPSESETYLKNSPDPSFLLPFKMN